MKSKLDPIDYADFDMCWKKPGPAETPDPRLTPGPGYKPGI